MAATARSADECKEFFDSEEEMNRKVDFLVQALKASKFAVAFTGAGISTAAGIADFRSGMGTVLSTGFGKWEKDANAKKPLKEQMERAVKAKTTQVQNAFPTYTHMA
ncbi:unnamed protein product [Amoebophrya sp. A25]|nr:unnamed protein product [Amoebophrya sp. A25]|eukprot:GSA25T00004218001.1